MSFISKILDAFKPESTMEMENTADGSEKTTNLNNEELEANMQEDNQKTQLIYMFPPISLLDTINNTENFREEIKEKSIKLLKTFHSFGINIEIVDIFYGPRFTRFEIQIEKGVRISDISSNLAIAIGKDVAGNNIVESLDNMCHLLIGGTIGSGKSVCISSIIISILYKAHPNDVKLLLIDTKAVNLTMYNGIPHLLVPVVTDLRKSTAALQWAVNEMVERYRKFGVFGARDLAAYNKTVEKYSSNDESPQKIPRIVIIIDDFSDLMTTYNGSAEESICRVAQMGRAAGIHLVISTQRPSVDVITGTIKANIPSRIAFNVFSAIDSRTILDTKGAEDLLFDGDMLFYPQGIRAPLRVQGAYVSDTEIINVVNFFNNQMVGYYGADYEKKAEQRQVVSNENELDPYFAEAGKIVIEKEKASIGMLQRMFKIGFNRAARIIDQLEEAGIVGPEEGTKPRRILMSMEQFERYIKEYL